MILTDSIQFTIEGGKEIIESSTVQGLACTVYQSIYGKNVYELRFFDSNVSRWNYFATQPLLECKMRVGVIQDGNKEDWGNWNVFKVRELKIHAGTSTVDVRIFGEDAFFDLKQNHPQRFFIKKSISEMIEEIAEDYELETDLVSTTGKYTLLQGWDSDYDFIKNELLPRGREVSEYDSFFFYIANQESGPELVLTTLAKKNQETPVMLWSVDEKNLTSKRDVFSRGFLVDYNSVRLIDHYDFGGKSCAFDYTKSQAIPYLISVSLNDSNVKYPSFKSIPYSNSLALSGSVGVIDPCTVDEGVKDFQREVTLRNRWPVRNSSRISIRSHLLHLLQPGDVAEVVCRTPANEVVFGSGNYIVYALMHQLTSQSFITEAFLERRGYAKGS